MKQGSVSDTASGAANISNDTQWTIDKPEYAEMLKAMGVDYISTNILE